MHVHDLVPFPTKNFDVSHRINKLSFGKVWAPGSSCMRRSSVCGSRVLSLL